MKQYYLAGLVLAFNFPAFAQDSTRNPSFVDAIEDNSFLIEEAYNQEEGVVQHISTLLYFSNPGSEAMYSFTQEWPLGDDSHQLGFTIPYQWLDGNSFSGIGDVLVNYRYQLSGRDSWATIAPRVSLILPIGDFNKGTGSGVFGVQINFPASKRISNSLVLHANIGGTILPGARTRLAGGREVAQTLASYNTGVSAIFLATQHFNFMAEFALTFLSDISERGDIVRSMETVVSPGVRYAIDFGELQIVPGIAIPFSFADGEHRTGIFFYLSFEHPF